MLSEEDIKSESNSGAFWKGTMLYKVNGVKDMTIEIEESNGNFFYHIYAEVKESGISYPVHISISEVEIIDYVCECEAFYSYDGLCSHCVAALIYYIENFKSLEQTRMLESMRGSKVFSVNAVKKNKETKRRTDARLRTLMSNLGNHDISHQVESIRNVRLEPYVTYAKEHLYVEFKIGVTQMYVLKNITDFVNRVKKEENYKYGKKLEFVHRKEHFDKESQALVDFLIQAVHEMEQMQERYFGNYYYYYTGLQLEREINLGSYLLDRFFRAMGERKFSLDGVYSKDITLWQVKDEEIRPRLQITGTTGGITFRLEDIPRIEGGEYEYFLVSPYVFRAPKREQAEIEQIKELAEAGAHHEAFVSDEDLPAFSREVLPLFQKHYDTKIEKFEVEKYLPPKPKYEIYLDMPQEDFITCQMFSVYEEEKKTKKYNCLKGMQWKEKRDIQDEYRATETVRPYFNAYDDKNFQMVLSGDEEMTFLLLTEGVEQLGKIGDVYISEQLKKLQVRPAPKVSIGVSLEGGLLDLKLTSEEMPLYQLAEILSKYNPKKRYYRLKNGTFVDLGEQEGLLKLGKLVENLSLKERDLKKGEIILPKYRALYVDGELRQNEELSFTRDKNFKALIRNMKTVEDNDYEVPENLERILRQYQKHGYIWLRTLADNGFAGILADDMGLGKSLQVITFLQEQIEQAEKTYRALIVCPASLVYNWKNEIEKFAPQLPARMIAGTAAERKQMLKELGSREILITSYDLLKRDILEYQDIQFDCEIIDEAQFIKNYNTQAARAVKEISAGFRIALTGTPVENRLSELWSIFDYLMSGFLFPYERFKKEFEIPIVSNQNEEAMERLRKMIAPFILRRLKKDVLKDLPDKIEEVVYAKMEGEQQKLYDAHVQRMKLMLEKQSEEEFRTQKIVILSELTRLRQLCCSPALVYDEYQDGSAKLDLCIQTVSNAVEGGHKILLFSQFTSMLELIRSRLKKEGIGFYELTGATSKKDRARMVEQFNEDAVPVFLISLKAGGTGLNLTAADIVIHYDPWWNIAAQNQATDRAHRIGQKNKVTVLKMIMKDTVEEKILELQTRKQELADQLLSGNDMANPTFSKEELLEILG